MWQSLTVQNRKHHCLRFVHYIKYDTCQTSFAGTPLSISKAWLTDLFLFDFQNADVHKLLVSLPSCHNCICHSTKWSLQPKKAKAQTSLYYCAGASLHHVRSVLTLSDYDATSCDKNNFVAKENPTLTLECSLQTKLNFTRIQGFKIESPTLAKNKLRLTNLVHHDQCCITIGYCAALSQTFCLELWVTDKLKPYTSSHWLQYAAGRMPWTRKPL